MVERVELIIWVVLFEDMILDFVECSFLAYRVYTNPLWIWNALICIDFDGLDRVLLGILLMNVMVP